MLIRPLYKGHLKRNRDRGDRIRSTTHRRNGLLCHEELEDRRLLDAGGIDVTPEQAIEAFSVSPALFVENRGQWAQETVRFAHFGAGANVLHTNGGPVFQLLQTESGAEAGNAGDPLAESGEGDTRHAQFTIRFDGASHVEPIGLDQAETVYNFFVGDPKT